MDRNTDGMAVQARLLTRTYRLGNHQVVGIDGVDLDIPESEMVVLKGNSGSGKSTLLALLAGLDRPTSGSLTVGGQNLAAASPSQLTRFRREVTGMVFQSFNLLPTLTVVENVCLPGMLAGHSFGKVKTRAVELLDWLGLASRTGHLPAQLSGGEMQRTAIARALINNPSIILADEPTGNLDSRNGTIVVELLTELNRKTGRTVIIATHSTMADSLATMHIHLKDGRITP